MVLHPNLHVVNTWKHPASSASDRALIAKTDTSWHFLVFTNYYDRSYYLISARKSRIHYSWERTSASLLYLTELNQENFFHLDKCGKLFHLYRFHPLINENWIWNYFIYTELFHLYINDKWDLIRSEFNQMQSKLI